MQITIEKDGDGYLAKVKKHPNLFAFAYSKKCYFRIKKCC